MDIQTHQGEAETTDSKFSKLSDVLSLFFCVLFLSFPCILPAQDQMSEAGENLKEEPEEVIVTLPDSKQMALALVTPGYREQVLLDLAAAASVVSWAEDRIEVDHAALAHNFLVDRAWLAMLVERYGWVQPRSPVLDPAAWLVLEELQQHDLEDLSLFFQGHSHESLLIYQVFQRTGERLAAANLPALLLEVEADAIKLWDTFLQLTGSEGSRDEAWKAVEDTWFKDREMPAPLTDDTDQTHQQAVKNIPLAMSKLVLSTVDSRPPDNGVLIQLRYTMLNEMTGLSVADNTRARVKDSLYLISLIDGLHDGRYFEFIQGLLSITSRLLEMQVNEDDTFSLVDWLVTELPAISEHYAVDFANVDPRLNAAMAAVYDVLLNISHASDTDSTDTESSYKSFDIKVLSSVLADAVAQLALLIPDMAYYFDTPVRHRIVEEINICISIAASLDDDGISTMTRGQFDACIETLLQLAERETRLAELSGNMNGPFTVDTLQRELSVTPWQRINYGIGYLHQRYSTDCQPPADALPNPLEWAVLANTMTWFAEHSPVFFETPQNETRLSKMRSIGEQLIFELAEQTGCFAATGSGINDPVSRSITDYELALRELDLGIENAETDFRQQRLSPGADVALEKDASQKTAYRPDGLVIEPCDPLAVCEMTGDLSATRALIGLFPDQYLIAQQTGMGHIEICYRNMEWVRRRSELVRPDDKNVANYFGHLAFDLVGRYAEKGQVSNIFAFRFTSPGEHHYLFAQTSDDVLNDSCPMEWIGTRVVTPLREKRGGIVPNRLTYLAASRKLPSRLLQNNWDRGAEWRDWFVTGIGVSKLEVAPVPEITTRLNQNLQSIYQAEQTEIYKRILLPNARNSQGDDVSLYDEMAQVTISKALIRMQLMLFYPESMMNSDKIRMAIAGDAGLLERRTLHRFREDNVALISVNRIALERLNKLREAWREQSETVRRQGSVPTSLMHALTRINNLYRQFFTSRPEPLQEIEVIARQRS